MSKFKVKFWYHAQGMEFGPETYELGFFDAENKKDAIHQAVLLKYPDGIGSMYGPDNAWSTADFYKSCLYAEEIK